MGTALSRAAQWTSVSDSNKGKLEFSKVNGKLLTQILEFTKSFPSKFPEEAAYVFKTELSWLTTTSADAFGSGYKTSGSHVTSSSQDDNGQPLLTLENGFLKVRTLAEASKILSVVKKENELQEVRLCLEANRDPIENILGPGFATVEGEEQTILRMFKKLEPEESKEGRIQLSLALLIQRFDVTLLNSSLLDISKEVRLSREAVDEEVDLLQKFAGDAPSCPIVRIDYASDVVFSNGCRAVPWRQVHGDICYLLVETHDQGMLSITASSFGCFINGGVKDDGTVMVEKKEGGEVYKNIVALLSDVSKTFRDNISNKSFTAFGGKSQSESDFTNIVENEADRESAVDRQSVEGKPTAQKTSKKVKTQKDRKSNMQPSMKWKNLETSDTKPTVTVVVKKQTRSGSKNLSPRAMRRASQYRNSVVDEEDISDSSDESEEEDEGQERRQDAGSDLPSEYWQIQKLVKYLKGGNQTATIIALCSMRDFNLMQETCQLAIRDVGGLEVLINLLDTEESKCKIGSLKILKEISRNVQIRRAIADLGGLQTMVKILRDSNKDLKCLAAETIANVAKFRRARRTVRQHGGIKKLVGLLDYSPTSKTAEQDVEVAKCGAMALWSCSKSTKNKIAIRKAGGIPLLARLLKSTNEEMLIPVVGTLQECASESTYRLAIRTEGMIQDLVKNLESSSSELQMHCAAAIFKCAEDKETRDLVREYNGLHPLVGLLSQSENKELLAAATGALWKCAISIENVTIMQELKAIEQLVALLTDQPEEVLVNVVGALGECAQVPANRLIIRKSGGIPNLVQLLTGTNQALLVNVTRAVGACATEQDNMVIIDKLDGVRLLWSLLKNQNPQVQASAAWAVCPCIENAKDAGEMVRSFVGGLELIVSLLKSNDTEVLASVCAAIANIAKDEENLAVITDHGVVPMLAKLASTKKDKLRRHLAESIARCCTWGNNRVSFGKEKAVAPLVHYLHSNDDNVHRATAQALYQLSRDPDNCITMHENGVVKLLLNMVGSSDNILQEAAAGCIGNIRKLALANEKTRYA